MRRSRRGRFRSGTPRSGGLRRRRAGALPVVLPVVDGQQVGRHPCHQGGAVRVAATAARPRDPPSPSSRWRCASTSSSSIRLSCAPACWWSASDASRRSITSSSSSSSTDLAALERAEFVLQFRELLGAEVPALQHRAVPVLPLADRVDLALELADVAVEVIDRHLHRDGGVLAGRAFRLEPPHLLLLGQRLAPVRDARVRCPRRRGRAVCAAPRDLRSRVGLLAGHGHSPYPPSVHGSVRGVSTFVYHRRADSTAAACAHHGYSQAQCATSTAPGPPARRCS